MEKNIQIVRVYPAPVALVWKAWTEAELIKKWWGPDRFTCRHAKIDFREGGVSLVSMQAPNEFGGTEWFNTWQYRRIVPLKRIEFEQRFSDADGRAIPPAAAGMPPDFPPVVFTVVTFEDKGNGTTEVVVTENGDMGQMTRNAKLGLEQCLDKMGRLFIR